MSVTLVTMVTFRGFRVLCLENILNLSTYVELQDQWNGPYFFS